MQWEMPNLEWPTSKTAFKADCHVKYTTLLYEQSRESFTGSLLFLYGILQNTILTDHLFY